MMLACLLAQVRRGEPEDEDALTPQHVRRSSAKSSSSSLWRDRLQALRRVVARRIWHMVGLLRRNARNLSVEGLLQSH